MKATLDCLGCIPVQTVRAAQIATPNSELQRHILEEVLATIPQMDIDECPAVLSLVAYETASRLSGNPDPYAPLRREQNAAALALEPELRAMVASSEHPLETALHLAAAGNIIDLGTQGEHQIDVQAAIAQVLEDRFSIDHSAAFYESLARCKDLLFLLDNAGEIVFDKILIEELLKHTSVTAVVKGAPMINDVIRADAEQTGLTAICEVIDNGGAFVGSPLDRVPARFLERMRRADVILGKGQGNYETVDDFPGDVFFILRAKCHVIAKHMGADFGQVAMISTRVRNCAGKGTSERREENAKGAHHRIERVG